MQVDAKNITGAWLVWAHDLHLAINSLRAKNGWVDIIWSVRGQHDHDVFQRYQTIHFGAELRHNGVRDIRKSTRRASPQDALCFIDEDED